MLNRESKICNHAVALFLLLFVFSCNKSYEKKEYYGERFEMLSKTPAYKEVFVSASDTIDHWIDMELTHYYQFNKKAKWAKYSIDNWIFFNSKMDKCIINLLIQEFHNRDLDDVYFILGEKHDNKWWFYDGPDLTIIQSVYDDDPNVLALPFSTLSQIARKTTLSWYYIEKPSGTCLKKLFSEGYDSYKKCSDEKYMINDQYFEDEFNYRPSFELRQKDYRERFLKNKLIPDSTQLNQ